MRARRAKINLLGYRAPPFSKGLDERRPTPAALSQGLDSALVITSSPHMFVQPPSSQVFLCWENWLYCFLIILDFADMWGESRSLSQMPFFWFLRGMEPCQAVGGLGPSKNNQSLIPNIPDSTNLSLHYFVGNDSRPLQKLGKKTRSRFSWFLPDHPEQS